MKKIMMLIAAAGFLVACNNEKADKAATAKCDPACVADSSLKLAFKANYTSQFTDKVADKDLTMVINSYKYWVDGDMKAVTGTLADSVYFQGWDGFKFSGVRANLLDIWTKHRDSLSSVKIDMDVWTRSHSMVDNTDYIDVWYKEIDTYKTGKLDSANYMDINQVKNGKISWYAQYRQELKQK